MSNATATTNGYGIDQILEVIENLSHSQGFYARLLETVLYAKDNNPDVYEQWKERMEAQNFKDPVDIVMFLEG